jgi:hypothetical protein
MLLKQILDFIKQWYSAEYSILNEGQSHEDCCNSVLMMQEDRKLSKRIVNKRKGRSWLSLQWLGLNVLPIFSKKSSFV